MVSDAAGRVKFHVPLASVPEGVKKLSIKAKAVKRPGNTTTGMVQPVSEAQGILTSPSLQQKLRRSSWM